MVLASKLLLRSLLLLMLFAKMIITVKCIIGYGQRGLRYSNEITWTRTCPLTDYCFEAVTSEIRKVRQLIDYPWDSYYDQFFVRSCGGDYRTKLDFHPWRVLPSSARTNLGSVKINLTTPFIITGQGGTEEFDLKYTCRHDLCTKVIGASTTHFRTSHLIVSFLLVLSTSYFLQHPHS